MMRSCLLAVLLLASPGIALGADLTVNRATQHQTIEGFGFFGARDVWWNAPSGFVTSEWVDQVIDDLGISIWRNEYYPPADAQHGQDATWAEQRPVVAALKAKADAAKVPLKFVFSVWTPPASMKCALDSNTRQPIQGTPNPGGTKDGGALCPDKKDAFVAWLQEGVQNYRDDGIDLYALSFQNEPLFVEPYNSCVYAPSYYAEVLAYVGPRLKAAFPGLRLFGSENMLAMEGGADRQWFYSAAIKARADSQPALDRLAVHGYSDGVLPTPSSATAQLWDTLRTEVGEPLGKPLWMTETSGFNETWADGPMELAMAMYAALAFGDVQAWIWWQGSELDGIGDYSLMQGTQSRGKKYYVSKNFYRFIRPGARRVEATSSDPELLAVAFDHAALGSFTVVAINAGTSSKTLNLVGTGLPGSFRAHRTSATEDCVDIGEVGASGIALSAKSVTTLVSGNVFEALAPAATGADAGVASNPGAGSINRGGGSGQASDGEGGACGCAHSGGPSLAGLALALAALRGSRRARSRR